MTTRYSKTQDSNNQIEINNIITNDDTTSDTVIETIIHLKKSPFMTEQ